MTTALATQQNRSIQSLDQLNEMSTQSLVDRKRKLVEVMNAVMKLDEHYGKIPGTNKPTLLKAGAEVLATVFGLAPTFKITRTDMPGGHREYEITCTLVHIPTGAVLGEGVGSCSTMESKYRWRKAFSDRKCPECGNATGALMKSKQKPEWFCWAKKGGCGETFALNDDRITGQEIGESKVENPDVADVYNTVLKMAKKRAQVDATLTAVGASDILTQDLEDLPEGSPRHEPAVGQVPANDPPASSQSKPADTAKSKPPIDVAGGIPESEVQAFTEMIAKAKNHANLKQVGQLIAKVAPKLGQVQADLLRMKYEEQQDLIDDAAQAEMQAGGR